MPDNTIIVRTRGTRATFIVQCLDGDEHRFVMTADGTLLNTHHDPDEDAVIAALGGEPHPCGQALRAYQAALVSNNAATGTSDSSNARYTRRKGWVEGGDCPSCTRRVSTARHLHSTEHQAHVHGVPQLARQAETLRRWLERNTAARGPYRDLTDVTNDFPRITRSTRSRYLHVSRDDLLTRPFIATGTGDLGLPLSDVLALRRNGITIQWLTELNARLTPTTRRALRRHLDNKMGVLIGARNISARKAADYLNAGIYAHLHTYARAEARPEDILAVYRADIPGTLADLLQSGMTLHEALVAAGVRTAN